MTEEQLDTDAKMKSNAEIGMTMPQNKVLRAGIITGSLVLGYLALVIVTPQFGKFVGYAAQQPPLRFVPAKRPASREEVDKMIRLIKLHFQNLPDLEKEYWPEPTLLEE